MAEVRKRVRSALVALLQKVIREALLSAVVSSEKVEAERDYNLRQKVATRVGKMKQRKRGSREDGELQVFARACLGVCQKVRLTWLAKAELRAPDVHKFAEPP